MTALVGETGKRIYGDTPHEVGSRVLTRANQRRVAAGEEPRGGMTRGARNLRRDGALLADLMNGLGRKD